MKNPLGAKKYKVKFKQVQSQPNSQKQFFGGINQGEITS